ncbi:hypothetical protein [Oceanisphaera sp.]|uniref:hypothetical protein n=1 Tax=Oceanisphaera sp. TaxID=1929979 RepID=UPI003A8E58FB
MCRIFIVVISLALIGACTSNKDLSGLSTASAVLLSVPLAPLAATYSVVTNEDGKINKQHEYWRQQLDPVYLQKNTQLLTKNPLADAEQVFAQGTVIFIPTLYGVSVYPGLAADRDAKAGQANQSLINNNPFLVDMQKLLAKDPAHSHDNSVNYRSDIYHCFRENASSYKKLFNIRMFELSDGSRPETLTLSKTKYNVKRRCHTDQEASWSNNRV